MSALCTGLSISSCLRASQGIMAGSELGPSLVQEAQAAVREVFARCTPRLRHHGILRVQRAASSLAVVTAACRRLSRKGHHR